MLIRSLPVLTLLVIPASLPLDAQLDSTGTQAAQRLQSSWTEAIENCTGDSRVFWDHGKRIDYRACERLLIAVTPAPISTKPLAYNVAVLSLRFDNIETDYPNWRFRTESAEMHSPLNPDRVAAKLRSRAAWAGFLAAFGAGMGRTYSGTVTNPDGTMSNVSVNVPGSSAEATEAANRAGGPLRTQAASIQDGAFRRTTVFPLGGLVGKVYFDGAKGKTGVLVYHVPSGREIEFAVAVKN